MLVTRENLTVAAQICEDVCAGTCHRELEDELRYIGLEDEDASIAKEKIIKYFENGGSKFDIFKCSINKYEAL
jgi:hypothetical protein